MMMVINNMLIILILPFILTCLYFGMKNLKDTLFVDRNFFSHKKSTCFTFQKIEQKFNSRRKIFIVLTWLLIFLFLTVILRNIYFCLFLSLFITIMIWDYFIMIQKRKVENIHIQLIEFLMHMIILLRSGKTVRTVFIESIEFTKNPLKDLLRRLVNQIQFKSSLEDALDDFMMQSESEEVQMFVTALKINNKIGGDLITVLNSIIGALKKSLEMRTRLKTATLQSRFTGNVIAFFPIVIFILLMLFMKNSLDDFFSSHFGNLMIISGGMLELSGFFYIKKIINND
jgi:tight adherence protein B